jgi:hypothetical protein
MWLQANGKKLKTDQSKQQDTAWHEELEDLKKLHNEFTLILENLRADCIKRSTEGVNVHLQPATTSNSATNLKIDQFVSVCSLDYTFVLAPSADPPFDRVRHQIPNTALCADVISSAKTEGGKTIRPASTGDTPNGFLHFDLATMEVHVMIPAATNPTCVCWVQYLPPTKHQLGSGKQEAKNAGEEINSVVLDELAAETLFRDYSKEHGHKDVFFEELFWGHPVLVVAEALDTGREYRLKKKDGTVIGTAVIGQKVCSVEDALKNGYRCFPFIYQHRDDLHYYGLDEFNSSSLTSSNTRFFKTELGDWHYWASLTPLARQFVACGFLCVQPFVPHALSHDLYTCLRALLTDEELWSTGPFKDTSPLACIVIHGKATQLNLQLILKGLVDVSTKKNRDAIWDKKYVDLNAAVVAAYTSCTSPFQQHGDFKMDEPGVVTFLQKLSSRAKEMNELYMEELRPLYDEKTPIQDPGVLKVLFNPTESQALHFDNLNPGALVVGSIVGPSKWTTNTHRCPFSPGAVLNPLLQLVFPPWEGPRASPERVPSGHSYAMFAGCAHRYAKLKFRSPHFPVSGERAFIHSELFPQHTTTSGPTPGLDEDNNYTQYFRWNADFVAFNKVQKDTNRDDARTLPRALIHDDGEWHSNFWKQVKSLQYSENITNVDVVGGFPLVFSTFVSPQVSIFMQKNTNALDTFAKTGGIGRFTLKEAAACAESDVSYVVGGPEDALYICFADTHASEISIKNDGEAEDASYSRSLKVGQACITSLWGQKYKLHPDNEEIRRFNLKLTDTQKTNMEKWTENEKESYTNALCDLFAVIEMK